MGMYDGLYQFKPQDAYDFANHVHIVTKTKGDELEFKRCPYCKGASSGKADERTFSINLTTGQFKCFRASCGVTGNMITLSRDFDFSLGLDVDRYYKPKPRKPFKKPAQKIIPKPPAIEYLASRGISEEVANRYEITTQDKRDNVLVFPFYDDRGDLYCIKYRKTDFDKEVDSCKEWFQPDGTPILFGMNQCNSDNKTIVITEGQLDSLSCTEAGIENAVSVPNGANGFTWIPFCWDWVNQFSEIIVFGDHEKGRITLLDEIKKRFRRQKIRHVREEDYLDCKDANDILRKYGKEQVRKCVENAVADPNKFVIDIADVEDINPFEIQKLGTGFKELDTMLYGGLPFGGITVLTGKSGLGKSTVASQLLLNAINTGHKVFAYSGELPNGTFKSWLVYQAAGKNHVEKYSTKWDGEGYRVNSNNKQIISEWMRGKIKIFDEENTTEDNEEADLLEIAETEIVKSGCDVILMDNLMTGLDVSMVTERDKYEKQSKFVKALARLAKVNNVLIILVAHMRKNGTGQNGNDEVGGSSDITNLASVTLMVDTDKDDENGRLLKLWKNRLFGKVNTKGWKMIYDERCKRLYQFDSDSDREYKWEQELFRNIGDEPTPFDE